jgi:hypothetical protein
MSPQNADLAVADAAPARLEPPAAAPERSRRSGRAAGRLARLRADAGRMSAMRDAWRALWMSRLVVAAAGIGTVLAFGFGPSRRVLDPPGLTRGLGWLGDVLVAPVARWDSSWFLVVARYGYRPDLWPATSARTAYFPLYPLSMRALGWLGAPLVLAGVLVSLVAFALALYGIHRLAVLELSRARARRQGRGGLAPDGAGEAARLAVLVTAFSPVAFFFSAVYSESLFLALSVGLFWCARHGRWRAVGILGALAAATRSTGLVLALPALTLYLYGPREDRPPDLPTAAPRSAPRGPGAMASLRRALASLRPRYRPRRDLAWLALLPVGVLAYLGWLALAGGDGLMPFHVQQQTWDRHLVGPVVGLWDALVAGWDGVLQLLSFQRSHVYFPLAAGDPFVVAWHNVLALAFLAAAVPAVIGVLRRLPAAYGVYALAAIAMPLSNPVAPEPLQSIARYLLVVFPLSIWAGAWLLEHGRVRRVAIPASAAAMALLTAEFATWHWIA